MHIKQDITLMCNLFGLCSNDRQFEQMSLDMEIAIELSDLEGNNHNCALSRILLRICVLELLDIYIAI